METIIGGAKKINRSKKMKRAEVENIDDGKGPKHIKEESILEPSYYPLSMKLLSVGGGILETKANVVFSKNIDYAKVDVNTIYGVFGVTLFVYKDLTIRKNFFKIIKRFFLVKNLIKYLKKQKTIFKFNKKYNFAQIKKNTRFFKSKKSFSLNKKKLSFFNFSKETKKPSVIEQIKQGTYTIRSLYGTK
jgi:hypothetical protein